MSDLETTTVVEAMIHTDMEIEDWDDAKDFASELVENWMTAHDVDPSDEVVVEYSGATWQRLSGYAPAVASSLPMIFKVNGDYTLRVKYDSADQSLVIVRYSHDEPMGATHVIRTITEIQD